MSTSILERTPPPAGLRLPYGPAPQQFGDLRLPDGPSPHPCVVAIHGGFWRARYDLEHLGHCCAALTIAGIATWNIEYRRAGDPGGGWPGTFRDVASAARHLVDIAPEHGIDPDRVIVAGHSAGGHLALWLAALRRIRRDSPIRSAPLLLRGAVSLACVPDLHEAWRLGLSDHAVGELLGGGPDDMPDRYADASPARLLPLGVPQVLIHGVNDDTVPFAMSESYAREARAHGDDVALVTLPNAGHFELIDPASDQWPRVVEAIRALLHRPTTVIPSR